MGDIHSKASCGFEATLTAGGVECGYCRDATLNITGDAVDATTRSSAGWREKLYGLKEWSISGELLYVLSDTGAAALWTAYTTKAVISIVIEDKFGGNWSGEGIVTSMTQNQPLADALTFSFEIQGSGVLDYKAS